MAEMKIYVEVRAINISSVYDNKLKKKLMKTLAKSAEKAFKKNSKTTVSKPSKWDKTKNKGFAINVELVSLTKKTAGKELLLKATYKILMVRMKDDKMVRKIASGSSTNKISTTHKDVDGEATFIAGYALEDVIAKYAIKAMVADKL